MLFSGIFGGSLLRTRFCGLTLFWLRFEELPRGIPKAGVVGLLGILVLTDEFHAIFEPPVTDLVEADLTIVLFEPSPLRR